MRTVVTTYAHPDLDGVASTLAYAELLANHQMSTKPLIFGSFDTETRWVLKKIKFKRPRSFSVHRQNIILVDASRFRSLPKGIKPEQVIEVIDHRKIHEAEQFPYAKIQIELVGAAATLITEKFILANKQPIFETAYMLYGAIISNTLNLKGTVTTDRDRAATQWLKSRYLISDQFIPEMFQSKSDVSGEKLLTRIQKDASWAQNGSYKVGIAQVEILNASIIAQQRKKEVLKLMQSLRLEQETNYSFASFVDLSNSVTIFLTDDPTLQGVLSEVFEVEFHDNLATYPYLILRKEIGPKMHDYFVAQQENV